MTLLTMADLHPFYRLPSQDICISYCRKRVKLRARPRQRQALNKVSRPVKPLSVQTHLLLAQPKALALGKLQQNHPKQGGPRAGRAKPQRCLPTSHNTRCCFALSYLPGLPLSAALHVDLCSMGNEDSLQYFPHICVEFSLLKILHL